MPWTGKQLISVLKELKENEDPALFDFTTGLFKELHLLNPDRHEKLVTPEQKTLDTLARLLVGDEICSAIALSCNHILIATNKATHQDDYLTYRGAFKILEKCYGMRYVLQFKYTLKYCEPTQLPRVIAKESEPVIYQYHAATNEFKAIEGNPTVAFAQTEHQIPFSYSPNITIKIPEPIHHEADIFNVVNQLELNKEEELFPEKPLELDPLRRRASKLLVHLAAIAHIHITTPELTNNVLEYNEKNKNWAQFLNDSLSYELAKRSVYKTYINPYNPSDNGDPGMRALLQFYEWLIEDYQLFKNRNNLVTNEQSIETWFVEIGKNIQTSRIPAPDFIKQNSDEFLECTGRYFKDLVTIEAFIETDAAQHGQLSMLLVQENLFKRSPTVKIIDGGNDVHAEMRLLDYHLTKNNTTSGYFGITMLCCALCHFTMDHLQLVGFRGSHGTLYPKWVLIDPVKQQYLQQFLGQNLYQQYLALQEKQFYPPGVKRDKKNLVAQSIAALELFACIGSINTKDAFDKLSIDQQYLLVGLTGIKLYPDHVGITPLPIPVVPENTSTNLATFNPETRQLFSGIFTEEKNIITKQDKLKLQKKYNLTDLTNQQLEKGLRNAAVNGKLDDLKVFLKLGANINAPNGSQQKTALHYALEKGHISCVRELIKQGANYNLPDKQGITAYNYAEQNHLDIFEQIKHIF